MHIDLVLCFVVIAVLLHLGFYVSVGFLQFPLFALPFIAYISPPNLSPFSSFVHYIVIDSLPTSFLPYLILFHSSDPTKSLNLLGFFSLLDTFRTFIPIPCQRILRPSSPIAFAILNIIRSATSSRPFHIRSALYPMPLAPYMPCSYGLCIMMDAPTRALLRYLYNVDPRSFFLLHLRDGVCRRPCSYIYM